MADNEFVSKLKLFAANPKMDTSELLRMIFPLDNAGTKVCLDFNDILRNVIINISYPISINEVLNFISSNNISTDAKIGYDGRKTYTIMKNDTSITLIKFYGDENITICPNFKKDNKFEWVKFVSELMTKP